MKKSDKYKYVKYDPDHSWGSKLSSQLDKAADYPWIATPVLWEKSAVGMRKARAKQVVRRFATEREAALYVDKWFLEKGRKPVNILKPKA